MKKVKSKFQKRQNEIIVFLAAFIPRMICSFFMEPVKVLMDEICTLNGAASFAGLDWSNVVEKGSYYGFGFYSLLAFIFKVTDNPYVIYHFILMVLVLIQSLTAPICYHILAKKFEIRDYRWCIVAAITCSYMVVSRAVAFVNEHPLILITWVAIWLLLLLCENQDNKRRKAIYTLLLLLLFSYAQLIHTRSITYWIAFLVLIVLYGAIYRRCLVSVSVFVGAVAVLVPVAQYLIIRYQNNIWDTTTEIANTTINVTVTNQIFKEDGIRAIIDIVLGEINTIGVYTAGIAYVAIVACIYILFQCVKERKKILVENNYFFVIIIFCCTCVGISIAGMAFSWGTAVTLGLSKDITYDYYSYKAFTYLRYFGPYLGPLLMVLFLFAKKNNYKICKMVFVAVLIMLPVQFYWMENIIPFISRNTTTNSAFILFAFWNESKELGSYIYYVGIKVMIIVPFIYERFKYYRKEIASLALVCIILFAQYLYGVYAQDRVWAEKNIVQADAGYKWVKEIEKEVVLPNEIYVQDNISTSHHKSYYIYQFMLNRYVILPGEPNEEIEEAILFENTEDNIGLLKEMGFQCVQLDENEYVFIKGNQLIKALQDKNSEY